MKSKADIILEKLATSQKMYRQPFDVKPKKDVKSRWSPLSPENRLTWSKMSPNQKNMIDAVVSGARTKRLAEHNKNYAIAQVEKGKRLREVLKRLETNPNKAHF